MSSPVTQTIPDRRRQRRRTLAVAAGAALLVAAGMVAFNLNRTADAATVGAGSYADSLPAGRSLPTGCGSISTNPRQWVTTNAPTGPVPTNDWWSSILYKKTDCAYGEPLHAHPVSYDTFPGGLGFSYNTTAQISGTATGVGEFHYPYVQDILVGPAGLASPDVKVDGWTDWTVTPYWSDGTRTMRATIGHGLPFAYFQITGGNAQITASGAPTVWSNAGATIGFTVAGHDYVAYAPTGSTWTVAGTTISSSLAGQNFFSIAALPTTPSTSAADRSALATTYGQYAHAHVTGTRVSYSYNQANSTLTTTYGFTTTARQGGATATVTALYPHQWQSLSGASPIAQTYTSARGQMKVLIGVTQFQTSMKFTGLLPEIPAVADSSGADLSTLTSYLAAVQANPTDIRGDDTYWNGKGLGRAARIAEIADQVNNTAVRTSALNAIRSTLNDWFTASPGKTTHVFYYNQPWGTLLGYPASYGSDTELNDHHFHYGYFIAAAATLAKFDPAWAAASQYGGMVDLLIRDANNYDRDDTRFPYLRDFDIYAGHDWASGHGAFAAGNNQESSSEGMNFANALIQWGQATGNTAVRDAGIYIYTTQSAAIQEYWFDSRNQNFPAAFGHNTVGMVWGDGGAYATWFSAEPEMIQGINMLPVTGGHFYLGDNPAYVTTNYNELVTNNGGPPTVWQDIIGEFHALGNGAAALTNFNANPGFTSEEGESKAHTYHWIRNLAALGTVDTTVTANHPLAKVFIKGGARTYVASNITANPLTVAFSNGTTLSVPAGKTATSGAFTWSGGNANGGTNPSPSPSASPTTSPPPTVVIIEAEAAGNTRSGVTRASSCAACSGGQKIGFIGNGVSNYLTVNNVVVPAAGSHQLTIRGLVAGTRTFSVSVNGAAATAVSMTGTSWSTPISSVTTVTLNAGANTIRFFNNTAWAPDLDRIEVRSTGGPSPSPTASPSPTPTGPFLATRYLQTDGGLTGTQGAAANVTVVAANGNHDGTPTNAVVYTATGITAAYTGAATSFDLFLDAGGAVGNGTQVRVSYDLTGDGSWERVETYRYFATDPVPGWEHYTQAAGLLSSSGALASMSGGQVKVEIWSAIGSSPTTLGIGNQSRVVLPFA